MKCNFSVIHKITPEYLLLITKIYKFLGEKV
jgi:hypothetical protein